MVDGKGKYTKAPKSRNDRFITNFCGFVCPDYIFALDEESQKELEDLLFETPELDIGELISQGMTFIMRQKDNPERYKEEIPEDGDNYGKRASEFIREYMGINLPYHKDIDPDFYRAIINHCIVNRSKPNLSTSSRAKKGWNKKGLPKTQYS